MIRSACLTFTLEAICAGDLHSLEQQSLVAFLSLMGTKAS